MVAEVKSRVDDCNLPQEDLNILLEPATAEERQIWLEAWSLYCEWECANKVVKANMAKGVAVPGRLVYIYFRQQMITHDESVPSDVLELARQYLAKHERDSTRRSWVCRWRQRWGFGVKALPSHKLECAEITRRKVMLSNITRARFATRRPVLFWRRSARFWGAPGAPQKAAQLGSGPAHVLLGIGRQLDLACLAPISRGARRSPSLEANLVGWCRYWCREGDPQWRAWDFQFFSFRRDVFGHRTHFVMQFSMCWGHGFGSMRGCFRGSCAPTAPAQSAQRVPSVARVA